MVSTARYSVDKYADLLFSYFEKLVPLKSKRENIKFRNSVMLNTPELHGMFKRVAALLVAKPNFDSLPEKHRASVENHLPSVLKQGKWDKNQFEIMYNLMFYDYLVAFEYPYTTYRTTCDVCGTIENINEGFTKTFSLTQSRNRATDKREIKAIFICAKCESRTPHHLAMTQHITNFVNYPTQTKLFNPLDIEVATGLGGSKKVWFSGMRYREHTPYGIREGVDLTSEQIVNVPIGIIEAILYGEAFMFNPRLVTVFTHPQLVGLDRSFAPFMLAMMTLLHTGILRKGREADALIKMAPQYLITPEGGAASPTNVLLDARKASGFILQKVKEMQEGDTGGISYLPFGVRTTQLFPDQRRMITTNELLAEEANLLQSTGFDNSVLQGGAGILNDPFLLQTVREVVMYYTDQLEDHLNVKIQLMAANDDRYNFDERLEVMDITMNDGTQTDNLVTQMVGQGTLPIGRLLRKVGYKNITELLEQKKEEAIKMKKHEIDMALEVAKIEKAVVPLTQATQTLDPATMGAFTKQLETEADGYAQQLYYMEEGQKKSALQALQKQNYTMWALVSKKLEDINYMQTAQAKAQTQQQPVQ